MTEAAFAKTVLVTEPSRFCGKCHRDLPCTARYFRPRYDRPSGLAYTCRDCSKRNRSRTTMSKRPYKGKRCFVCEGMAHRRPEHRACACGERYEAEPPMTVEDAMRCPRKYDREVSL